MCGICGFVGARDDEALRAMTTALAHRGPDESGAFVADDVSFGHRRLSIIDLARGQQPFASADGSIVLVFNGEIYNHRELRRDLEARGHRYQTHCDTESIVHAYREFGLECAERLDGMFAFVLYDRQRRRLFGARDRLGKKPLYYTRGVGSDDLRFAFASELKSLVAHPRVRSALRLSTASVHAFLLHDYVPADASIYDGIQKLGAGSAFTFQVADPDATRFATWQYWTNPIEAGGPASPVSEREAARHCIALLQRAIDRRLMADVPLGVFLSGGIDSSTIVALLSQQLPPGDIRTFAIGFEQESFDESHHAAQVAAHFGTDHHTRQFTAAECLDEIAFVTARLDEPLADPSILPLSLLCRFARETVTVALGGDGGDELFAGYDPFRALWPAAVYDTITPQWLHDAVCIRLARMLPVSDANMSLDFRVNRLLRGAKCRREIRLPTWMGPFDGPGLRRLLPDSTPEDLARGNAPMEELYRTIAGRGGDPVRQATAYFQRFYLTDDILVKVDRVSMMHSLEVRAPFLDTLLVEYVNMLPSNFKLRHGATKYLLKRAVSNGILPPSIVHRRKKGFGIPVARWIRRDLKRQFYENLVLEWPTALDMFDHGEIARLYQQHVRGAENNYKELWALFMLAAWATHTMRA